MRQTDRKAVSSADWLSKTLAGLILGLAIAFVCMGFYAWYGPGDIHAANKSQFVMWLVSPIFLVILAAVYLFPSGKQAWTVLFVVTVLLYFCFFLLRSL